MSDGRIELDSNTVERAIRPQTITRKNSLFAGSDGGGRTWAAIASLLATAKMNSVDPHAWLTQTLERIAQGGPTAISRPSCRGTINPERPQLPLTDIVRDSVRVLSKMNSRKALRDRALLLIGFAAALRRSELSAIDIEHLRFTAEGLVLTLPRRKRSARHGH